MGRYITQAARVKKQQVFTVSGIFTPSPGLLAAGGVVEVRCVGGGGAGHPGYSSSSDPNHRSGGGGGGSGTDITRIVSISQPIPVTIGSGSVVTHDGTWWISGAGGTTSFGTLVTAEGGGGGLGTMGGNAGGLGGFSGESSSPKTGASSSSNTPTHGQGGGAGGQPAAPNSGGGGAGGSAYSSGGSGICIITWEE